jgi:predicted DCC family thiol-disulfide oxidoreductase YuxK
MRPRPPAVRAALFDGRCAVCSRSARWIGARDRDGRIERLDLRDDATAARFPSLSPDAVRAQMHVVTPDGAVAIGIDGVRAVLEVLPGWSLAARVLGVPGLRAVAGVVYRAFARHRLTFNRWIPLPEGEEACTDACAVDWAALERAAAERPPGSPP